MYQGKLQEAKGPAIFVSSKPTGTKHNVTDITFGLPLDKSSGII